MTVVGAGGVVIKTTEKLTRFKRDYRKLDPQMQERVDDTLKDLYKAPFPPGLRFEKLKGYSNPDVYTVHVTGNYKISMEICGTHAVLRRVATHNEIDRQA